MYLTGDTYDGTFVEGLRAGAEQGFFGSCTIPCVHQIAARIYCGAMYTQTFSIRMIFQVDTIRLIISFDLEMESRCAKNSTAKRHAEQNTKTKVKAFMSSSRMAIPMKAGALLQSHPMDRSGPRDV